MTTFKVKATIWYKVDKGHPDITKSDIEDGVLDRTLEFTDTYTIDPDRFWSSEDIDHYIKHDLALVAGGGYDTDHIYNVKYQLTRGV